MTSTDIVDETAAVVERPTFQNRHPQLEAAARAIATLTTKEYAQDEIWEEDLELFYKQFARNERTSPMTAAWEALQSVERLSRERDQAREALELAEPILAAVSMLLREDRILVCRDEILTAALQRARSVLHPEKEDNS